MIKTQISDTNVQTFLELDLKIPMYQRPDDRWNNTKKVELLISILSGFPIGTVVLNENPDDDIKLLMDGQQRRSALQSIMTFREIFVWLSQSPFKQDPEPDGDLDIGEILLNFLESKYFNSQGDGEGEGMLYNPIDWDFQLNKGEGKKNLAILVQLRKLLGEYKSWTIKGHPQKVFKIERIFDSNSFKDENFPFRDLDNHFSPSKVWKMFFDFVELIGGIDNIENTDTAEKFIKYLPQNMGHYEFKGDKQDALQKLNNDILSNWPNTANILKYSMAIIKAIRSHPLGMVTYTEDSNSKVGSYDLPTIFRFINDGGEPLSDVEIFASMGNWVGKGAEIPASSASQLISKFQPLLNLSHPNDAHDLSQFPLTKWKICSIFGTAFEKDNNWLKKNWNYDSKKEVRSVSNMQNSFKTFSLFYDNSVSKKDWSAGWSKPTTDGRWLNVDILDDYQKITKHITTDRYFRALLSWDQNNNFQGLSKFSQSVSMDLQYFTRALHLLFVAASKPTENATPRARKKFIIPARKFMDWFIFTRLENPQKLIFPPPKADTNLKTCLNELAANPQITHITESKWTKLLDNLFDGIDMQDNDYTSRDIEPKDSKQPPWVNVLLAHISATQGISNPNPGNKVTVDHIIPKASWQSKIDSLDPDKKPEANHCNNILNFCLLDFNGNASKNSKKLNDTSIAPDIRKNIAISSGISETNFDEFSEIKDDTIDRLKNVRENMLKTNFLLKRTELFQDL